jgi:hypothetical protein
MNKQRNYIEEILSIRGRNLPQAERIEQLTSRVDNLWYALHHVEGNIPDNAPIKSELLKYFPIGLVACIEGYFRLVYKGLIDHGPPYRDNVINFKDLKLTMDSVLAIHSQTISLGEFVAHLLPGNNLDDINRNMSVLMDEDFLERLKRTPIPAEGKEAKNMSEAEIEDFVFSGVKRLFELRHIHCHELATSGVVKGESIEGCAVAALALAHFTELLIRELLGENPAA